MAERISEAFYRRKVADLKSRLAEEGLAAIFVATPPSIAYLSGFFHYPSERPIVLCVPATGDPALLVPRLEAEHAAETWIREIVIYEEFPGIASPLESLARWCRDREIWNGAIGYEESIAVGLLNAYQRALPHATFQGTGHLIRSLRLVKEPEELSLMEGAAGISDFMVSEGIRFLARCGAGISEVEVVEFVRARAMDRIRDEHSDLVFIQGVVGGLVNFGSHSALPHGLPSLRRLEEGDAVILSLGCQLGGYAAESERTVFYRPTARHRPFYEAVRAAQEVGITGLRPGVKCADANRDCLSSLRDAGFGDYIRHRQGHGMGIMFHEEPWVEDGDETILAPGMVVSSEPGLYVPGWAGYRIADTVAVTESGSRRLTRFPNDWDAVQVPG